MKAIVVVFAPTRDDITPIHRLKRRVNVCVRKANRSLKLSAPDQVMPPFWTWFIENPRRFGAK